MLKYLDGGPILNLIFLGIGIIGILIGIYYGKKVKKLVYNIKSTNFIHAYENVIPHITVLYKNSSVPNLTIVKLGIWNIGNDVINNTDIPTLDPIQIIVNKPFQILEAFINYASKPANDFLIKVSDDKQRINLNFDFIDKNDGVVLTLFHTGNNINDLKLSGIIKGTEGIENYEFLSTYNVGAICAKLLLIRLGGKKGTILGTLVRILFFPIAFLLILPGDILLSLGGDRFKYNLIKKEFFLD